MRCKNLKLLNALCVVIFMLFGCAQPESEPPHVHTFNTDWTTDDTSHWHAATCEHATAVSGKVDHQFPETWTLVTAATEEADGLEERFCDICNYRATQVIPQLNHNHDIAKVWSTDSTKHWHAASCGRAEHNEDVGEHTWNHEDYQYDSESGKDIKICTVCSYVDDKAHNHTEAKGKITKVPTYTTKGEVTYICTVCRNEVKKEIELYKFHEEPVKFTSGTDGTAGTAATYVEFGDWPQSVLPVTSTVTVDETLSVIMGANTYYLGSDGNYYAKCAENAYGTDDDYKYHDGTQAGTGGITTRYFKVEPIKWRVLTDNYSGKKLLLAENILTANVPYCNSSIFTRTVGSDTNIYPNNYKYSQIRAYLNGLDYYYYDLTSTETTKKTDYTGKGFLHTAFTQSAQALIAETVVDNSKETTGYSESTYATEYACENTTDKIFLLSESEVINSDYGFAAYNSYVKKNRIRFVTDYAKANYAYQDSTRYGYGGYWWLRSPFYRYGSCARLINPYGDADGDRNVSGGNEGVVPALSISF